MEQVTGAVISAIFIVIAMIIAVGVAIEELREHDRVSFVTSVMMIMGMIGALALQVFIMVTRWP